MRLQIWVANVNYADQTWLVKMPARPAVSVCGKKKTQIIPGSQGKAHETRNCNLADRRSQWLARRKWSKSCESVDWISYFLRLSEIDEMKRGFKLLMFVHHCQEGARRLCAGVSSLLASSCSNVLRHYVTIYHDSAEIDSWHMYSYVQTNVQLFGNGYLRAGFK